MGDMTNDVFARYGFGKAALSKIGPVDQNFRLYEAVWIGDGLQRDLMKVTGAVFRCAARGTNHGKLSVMVPNTKRTVYVSAEEIRKFGDQEPMQA